MKISEISVKYTSPKHQFQVKTSREAYEIFTHNWNQDLIELLEEFKVLLLNKSNYPIGIYPLSKGGISGTVVDIRLIFGIAVKCAASSIIIAHNHPSGNLMPSEADISLTKKIKGAGEILDIKVLDHLIISKAGYYSFADEENIL